MTRKILRTMPFRRKPSCSSRTRKKENQMMKQAGYNTSRFRTLGTGVTGSEVGPIPSQNVYSALSVLIMVHDAPSFIISLLASFGHGEAYIA